ncbi:GNAT family N-acetyltransferase [Bacillus sp. REN10]|uniref:GNAT family N-acetyltransferase n=1 Tax=Bacillus sp. REN10 TaxID=2782541 RepID=UPI00193C4248|nr:GNAT family N-acetyltransferase [Bacillus sp. REN10]
MIKVNVNYKIFDLQHKDAWLDFVTACETYDPFYLPQYVQMYEERGEGKAQLFVYERSSEEFVIYPFLKRDIEDSGYYDIVTPYGYGGPLYSLSRLKEDDGFIREFRAEFERYCQAERIVSEFIRFHPYLETDAGLARYIHVTSIGEVIYNDVAKTEEAIWSEVGASKKRRIKKSKRNEVEIQFVDGKDIGPREILIFYDIYTETMDKKQASSFYYFSLPFFQAYFVALQDHIMLAFALYEGRVISANLLLKSEGFVTIHLSASFKQYLHLCPNCHLRYECILWAKRNGYRIIDHGGGKEKGDSLYKYKQQFSTTEKHFCIGKKIHNHAIYNQLADAKTNTIQGEQASFFPEYRQVPVTPRNLSNQ